jgi:hypothetical protein
VAAATAGSGGCTQQQWPPLRVSIPQLTCRLLHRLAC